MDQLTQDESYILSMALDRVVAYRPIFAKIIGSVTAAIILSQYYYWSQKKEAIDRDGWFFKTEQDCYDETGLSKYEQRTARKELTKLEILETKKIGLPAKNWYRINQKKVANMLMNNDHQWLIKPTTGASENQPHTYTKITTNTITYSNSSKSPSEFEKKQNKDKSGYGNKLVNHALEKFSEIYKHPPIDKKIRWESGTLVRQIISKINIGERSPNNIMLVIDTFFDWVKNQESLKQAKTMNAIRRNFIIYYSQLKNKKEEF